MMLFINRRKERKDNNIRLINSRGFTLLEIVVAIAILGIALMCLLPMFANAFISIKSSGNRTEATYNNQRIIEKNESIESENHTITVKFDNVEFDIDISVFEVESEYNNDQRTTSMFYFETN